MAEETTAGRRAWSLMMGTVENPSDGATFRKILFLVLLAGICISVYAIYEERNYIPPQIVEPVNRPPTADINRLNTMIQDLNAANSARTRSKEVAEAAELMARCPFTPERIAAVNEIDLESIRTQTVIVPPGVQVRATLQLEGRSAAVLDIEGETRGKIYRVGDRFAGNKGRISRINADKITIVFENKEFTYTP